MSHLNPEVEKLVKALASAKTVTDDVPTVDQVRDYLKTCFPGAERYAVPFHRAASRKHWQDKNRKPIRNWRVLAKSYASVSHLAS